MALRVWLPLNGNLENKGISDIAIANNNITFADNGKIGEKAATGRFDFTTIPQSQNILNTKHFSISFWAKIKAVPSGTSEGVTYIMKCGANGTNTCLHIAIRNTGAMAFCFYSNDFTFLSSVNDYIDVWTHFAFVYDSPNQIVYINGAEIGRRVGSGDLTVADNSSFIFYNDPTYLNDVRIYDHALSAKEVKEISQGLVLHYKLDGLGGVGINLLEGNYEVTTTSSGNTTYGFLSLDQELMPLSALPGKTLTFTYDYSIEGIKANNTGNWNQDRYGIHLSYNYTNGSTTSNAYPGAGYLTVSGTGRAVQTFTIPSNITINSFSVGIQPFNRPAEGNSNIWYLKNVKLEVGDQDTGWIPYDSNDNQISDSSGYNNTYASVYDIIFNSENGPRYNVNANFYNNYSAIELRDQWRVVNGEWVQVWSPNIKSQTIAFWWYSSNWQNYTSSEYSILVCNGTNFSIDIINNNIRLNLSTTTGNTNSWNLISLTNLNTGWHYFTLTYSNKQIVFYLDGLQTKTINVTVNDVLDYFLIQNNLLIGNPQIM